jgi:hypothetical protein
VSSGSTATYLRVGVAPLESVLAVGAEKVVLLEERQAVVVENVVVVEKAVVAEQQAVVVEKVV